jgi:hypothetical protein
VDAVVVWDGKVRRGTRVCGVHKAIPRPAGVKRYPYVYPRSVIIVVAMLYLWYHTLAATCLPAEQALHRKRMLGGGPHGALHAAYTSDEEHVVAAFQVCVRAVVVGAASACVIRITTGVHATHE